MSKLGTWGIGMPISVNVEKPIHAIGFEFKIPRDEFKDDTFPGSIKELLNWLRGDFDANVNIDVKYIKRNGSFDQAIPKIPLLPLLEIESQNDGHISATIVEDNLIIRSILPLSEAGAIPFDNDETAKIEMGVNNRAETTLYAFDHPMSSPVWTEYGFLNVKQGEKNPEFDIKDAEVVVIPIAEISDSTEIQLSYSNGKTVSYKRDELMILGTQTNEVAVNFNGLVQSGFANHVILTVGNAERIKISRLSSAGFDMFVVKENVHGKFEESNAKNAMLKHVSTERKIKQLNNLRHG